MSRRANLPGAAELFRVTGVPAAEPESPSAEAALPDGDPPAADPPPPVPLRRAGAAPAPRSGGAPPAPATLSASTPDPSPKRRPSGRERHDEKITVYISPEELHDLEHARLVLRREHGVRADRGRLVRVALALVLGDLEAHGEDSDLVRRLREQ